QFLPDSTYSTCFLSITLIESVINITTETVIIIRTDLVKSFTQLTRSSTRTSRNPLTVYLLIFILSHLVQLYYAFDALRQRNTIQLIGLCGFNLAIMAYAIIQIPEIRQLEQIAITNSNDDDQSIHHSQLTTLILLVAIPSVIGICQIAFSILTFHLFQEFGWQIYKQIGADRRLKRMYMIYQIFICSIKFDYFFLIAFALQLVLLVPSVSTVERILTILALPTTLLLLGTGYYGVRFESRSMMGLFGFGLLSGTGYFSYKLFRIWHGRNNPMSYQNVFKSLTVFSVICLLMTVATFTLALVCTKNFDNGLKAHMKQTSGVLKSIGIKTTKTNKRYPNQIHLTDTGISSPKSSTLKSYKLDDRLEDDEEREGNFEMEIEGFDHHYQNDSTKHSTTTTKSSRSKVKTKSDGFSRGDDLFGVGREEDDLRYLSDHRQYNSRGRSDLDNRMTID
ncbi:hypothetical protein PPACK8108_LOCUS9378, partial [Phakopsora pachyrhizi]